MTLWSRVRGVARAQLGLELDAAALKPLESAFAAQGLSVPAQEAFVRTLESQGPASDAFRTLVRSVTNGQTYFMRDPAQLSALETFLRARAGTSSQPLYIWCAGCSTGEEPYTVSMLARGAGVPVRIVGTDINPEALENAQKAEYGEWSLRHVEARDRLSHFVRSRRGLRASDAVRGQVSFQKHNLALDGPLASPAAHKSWDVILCRNVLIYFAPESRAQVVHGFDAVLAADGALLLSSAESVRGLGTRLRPRYLGGGYLLTPGLAGASLAPAMSTTDPARPRHDAYRSESPPSQRPRPSLLPGPRTRATSAAKYWMDLGNDWLKQHEFDQALDAYVQAKRLDGVSFEPYLLMALVRIKRAELEEAKSALRSALFLEPRAWSAEYLLGGIYAREGNASEARAAFSRALAILESDGPQVGYDSECSAIEPLCYTHAEALATCRKRQGTGREGGRR